MDGIVAFLKDFGALISLGVVVSVAAFFFKLYKNVRDAQVELLRELSVESYARRIRDIKEWYESSLKVLDQQKQMAIEKNKTEYAEKLEEEKKQRQEIIEKSLRKISEDQGSGKPFRITEADIVGDYVLVGENARERNYFGTLGIVKDGAIYRATWKIGEQAHEIKGVGLLVDGNLSVGFSIEGALGVVVYRVIADGIAEGLWTWHRTNGVFYERCRKVHRRSAENTKLELKEQSISLRKRQRG